uniref:Uncharacterized protein n=1 Tax=Ciona intestinalis TaxID=7719 RepID=H2XSC9_CIOIN
MCTFQSRTSVPEDAWDYPCFGKDKAVMYRGPYIFL